MQKLPIRSIVAAALYMLCGIAGTVATYAPEGPVQQAANAVATQCEANGIPAFPVLEAPRPVEDAGTPAAATPAPAIPQPLVPSTGGDRAELSPPRLHLVSRTAFSLAASHVRPPTAEAWPGEARGWV